MAQKNGRKRTVSWQALLFLAAVYLFVLALQHFLSPQQSPQDQQPIDVPNSALELVEGEDARPEAIPEFSGSPYVTVNGNVPTFTEDDLVEIAYESYSDLDALGRCGVAEACVGRELMPTAKREEIYKVKPTGWRQAWYDFMEDEPLYNRCHLIAFQLTGENANERNLITGTHYMNVEGMKPFEEMVGNYVRDTDNHVIYRVTPVFSGRDLVARGVQMEAYSIEDQGKGICFNIFCYNAQPGVEIDYATGESALSEEPGALPVPNAA